MVYHLRLASFCACDDECGSGGICVLGICQVSAATACSSAGSTEECPAGSRCWGLGGFDDSAICWVDCDAVPCEGVCDADGSCAPEASSDCDASCGSYCTDTDAPADSSDPTDASGQLTLSDNPVAPGSVGLGCAQDSDCAAGLECITAGFIRWLLLRARLQCWCCPEESDCFITEENEPTMCLHSANPMQIAASATAALTLVSATRWSEWLRALKDVPKGPARMERSARVAEAACPWHLISRWAGARCSSAAPDFTNCSLNGGNNACSDLVVMDPRRTDSYWDYPLNGETSTNQYRSLSSS